VVTRFVVEPADATDFVARAHTALATLAARPGYRYGQLACSVDEPSRWCLVTDWESVGAYRRALSAYEVKLHATALLAGSLDEPSAYEVLVSAGADGAVTVATSDRATAEPGSR